MEKKEFLNLNPIQRMNYLNKILKEDNNLTLGKICKEIIKIDEKTNRTYLNKHNIIFDKNKRQYYIQNTNVTHENDIKDNQDNTNVTQKENIEIIDNYKENTNVTLINKIDVKMQQNIIDIMQDAEILKQMIEQYKANTTVLHQKLIIDLPVSSTKHTTMRVNEIVLDDFNKFAEKNKQYSKIDLVSQALKEFIEKYN